MKRNITEILKDLKKASERFEKAYEEYLETESNEVSHKLDIIDIELRKLDKEIRDIAPDFDLDEYLYN